MLNNLDPNILQRARKIYNFSKDEFINISDRIGKMPTHLTGQEMMHEFDHEFKTGQDKLIQAVTMVLCSHDGIADSDHAITTDKDGSAHKSQNYQDIVQLIASQIQ